MTFIEDTGYDDSATTGQRWSNLFVVALGLLSVFIALNMKNTIENRKSIYENSEVGIIAYYPQDWLLDDTMNDATFAVTDIQNINYQTTFLVDVQPISADTTQRVIFDALTMRRAQTLSTYQVLAIDTYVASDAVEPFPAMLYTFVDTPANPFLQAIPTVVRGIDVMKIRRGQTMIITMHAAADEFDQQLDAFNEFVLSLEF